MINRKFILSILSLGMLAIVASAGTYAYFNDAQTTGQDTVQAGTLKLNGDIVSQHVNIGNAQPGDNNVLIPGALLVANAGSLPGVITADIVNVQGDEMKGDMRVYITDKTGATKLLFDGTNVNQVVLGSFAPGEPISPRVFYSFVDNGDQNTAQGKVFSFNIKFTLNQVPRPSA